MRNKSASTTASIMGATDKSKSSTARATRAREAAKRGFDDNSGSACSGNKKKHPMGGGGSFQDHQFLDNSLSGDPHSPPLEEGEKEAEEEALQPVNTKTLNNHVALIMNKLNSIEGNTSTLNNKVSSLFSKMENQSVRIKETESSLEAQSQQIRELKKEQSSIIQEVNTNVEVQMKSFRDELRKDNELFRAELINATYKKIDQKVDQQIDQKVDQKVDRATEGMREDFLEEQSVSREKNLIIMGLQESQEGGDDWDLVKALFKDSLGITKVDIETLY